MNAGVFQPLDVVALEAVRVVAVEYGIQAGELKPCIAYHLAGGEALADRRKVAFTLAIELRRLGRTPAQAEQALNQWAGRSGARASEIRSALRSAFQKRPDGEWRYHAPGLAKQSPVYIEVLKPICDQVGCPANCPAFAGKYQGPVKETFERFKELGWVAELKKRRQRAAIDVYEAICRREKQLHLAPGAELLTTYRQLGELGEVHPTTVGDALRHLHELGLISFVAGSGSGPHARDKTPSRVKRVVPIPRLPGSSIPVSKAGGGSRPYIDRRRQRRDGDPRHFQSWGGLTESKAGQQRPHQPPEARGGNGQTKAQRR